MRVLVLVLSVLVLSFFFVFSFHAQTPLQEQVKSSLESGGEFPFSAQANDHMRDVFDVLLGGRFAGALLAVALLWLLPSLSALHLRVSGALLVSLPVVLASLEWASLFTAVHMVLFPQGNWRFPVDSLIIQTYPPLFFVEFAAAWGVLVGLCGLVLLWLSASDQFKKRSR